MEKWYSIDETWSVFGISNRKLYAQNYVVDGRFHVKVPQEVVDAYSTAEYLMAHAWYHYPMYDEALKKLLGILEMAVKLKCQLLGIGITYSDKNGKERNYDLSVLIDKVSALEKDKNLKERLHKARQIRNHYAHPSRHSFTGSIAKQAIIPLVNLINLLFIEEKVIKDANQKKEYLAKQFQTFQQGLFILEWNNKKILISQAIPINSYKINNDWISFWGLKPILTKVFEKISAHNYSPPITLGISDLKLNNNSLIAQLIESKEEISLTPTSDSLNQIKYQSYLQEWNQLSEQDQHMFEIYQHNEISKNINAFQYSHYWV